MKKPLPDDKVVIKRYSDSLADIKSRIRQAQNRAVTSANAEYLKSKAWNHEAIPHALY
jgi:hypothetical protein